MAMRNGREWADGRRRDRERVEWAEQRERIRRESEQQRLAELAKTPAWLMPDEVPEDDGLDEIFDGLRNTKAAEVVEPDQFKTSIADYIKREVARRAAQKDFARDPVRDSDVAQTAVDAMKSITGNPVALLQYALKMIESREWNVANFDVERQAFDENIFLTFKLAPRFANSRGVASPSESDMGLGDRPATTPTQRARASAEEVMKGASLGVPVRKIDL